MFFPDLKSIQELAKDMSRNKDDRQYKGIHPKDETELPEARRQLAEYMRKVWHDEIFALEIERGKEEG